MIFDYQSLLVYYHLRQSRPYRACAPPTGGNNPGHLEPALRYPKQSDSPQAYCLPSSHLMTQTSVSILCSHQRDPHRPQRGDLPPSKTAGAAQPSHFLLTFSDGACCSWQATTGGDAPVLTVLLQSAQRSWMTGAQPQAV